MTSPSLEELKFRIRDLNAAEKREIEAFLHNRHATEIDYGLGYETILDAIARSSAFTRRGIKGVIAEHVFVGKVLGPEIAQTGWRITDGGGGDESYDVGLQKGDGPNAVRVRIEVKIQRSEDEERGGKPKCYAGGDFYAELQRTRSGKAAKEETSDAGEPLSDLAEEEESTRPYEFDEFDLLAVCLRPALRFNDTCARPEHWEAFAYTLARTLKPRIIYPKPKQDSSDDKPAQPLAFSLEAASAKDVKTCPVGPGRTCIATMQRIPASMALPAAEDAKNWTCSLKRALDAFENLPPEDRHKRGDYVAFKRHRATGATKQSLPVGEHLPGLAGR